MLRHQHPTMLGSRLALVLLLGLVAVAAPALSPTPAAAREPAACDEYRGSHPTVNLWTFDSKDVAHAQCLLNYRGYDLAVDGDFGPKTLKAVKKYQRDQGLQDDGVVGPCTWAALHPGEHPGERCFAGRGGRP